MILSEHFQTLIKNPQKKIESIPVTHIYITAHFHGFVIIYKGTSMTSVCVQSVLGIQTSTRSEIMRSYKCCPHVSSFAI